MNHDIAHCKGEFKIPRNHHDTLSVTVTCDKRDTCRRFLAYIDTLTANLLPCIPLSFLTPEECINLDHDRYLEEKE
ncbi:MAG: hypothetical protein K6F72_00270 [Bacteroidales bacterium]|nr:hypothetical protein [Bacteroidales bacterium]